MIRIKKLALAFVICALALGQWVVPARAETEARGQSDLFRAVMDAAARDADPFAAQGDAFVAAHGALDAELRDGRFSVRGQDAAWVWDVRLSGIGKGSRVDSVGDGAAGQGQDGRVSMKYAGVVEWQRVTSLGIQQGFDVPRAPRGEGALEVRLALNTDMPATLSEDERSLSFDAGNGMVLHYAGLRAFDANGVELSARMVLRENEIALVVDDAGALYPVTVDPVVYYQTKLPPTNPVTDGYFGASVDIDGNTAVVGEPGSDYDLSKAGRAYVFERVSGVWMYKQDLVAIWDGDPGDRFGRSVAVSGNIIAVGAPNNTVGGNANQGSVYVYTKDANGQWSYTTALSASNGAASDRFGYSVEVADGKIFVGSPYASNQGWVYVFGYVGGVWQETQALSSAIPSGFVTGTVGYSLAVSGDWLVAGAPNFITFGTINPGAAVVFKRSAGLWQYHSTLTAPLMTNGDKFGYSVDIDGDTIIVGAPETDDTNLSLNARGAAYVYSLAAAWAYEATLVDASGGSFHRFGYSVAMNGEEAFVGSDVILGSATYGDRISRFKRSGGAWGQYADFLELSAGAERGISIGVSGGMLIVGVADYNITGAARSGMAYIYDTPQTGFDLGVDVAASDNRLNFGDWITFTARLRNYGPADGGANVYVPLPAGINLQYQFVSHGTYNPVTGLWSGVSLLAGESATLTIQATVDTSINNTVKKFSAAIPNGVDSNNANNAEGLAVVIGNPQVMINPSFEVDNAAPLKVPDGWTKLGVWAAADGRTTAYKKGGTASVLLTGDGTRKSLTQSFVFPGVSGDKFTLGLWSKAAAVPAGALYRVVFKAYNGNTLVATQVANFSVGTHDFQYKNIAYTATSTFTSVIVVIEFKAASGKAWFDIAALTMTPVP